MAELTSARNNATPYPIYGLPWVVTFPLLDADGDPISPSSPDSEVSKNADTFADCTNEAVEIATSSGICYLILTGTEMTADVVTVRIQSTGAKTTVLTLYPRKLVALSSGTCQGANDTGDIQLASGDSAIDDYYNGCIVVAVIDSTTEVRMINDYVGSTKVAEVSPAFNTAIPDSDDTYTIYLPEGRQMPQADVKAFGGTAGTFSGGRPEVNTTHAAGTAWGSGAITAASIASDAITAAKIADNAIDAGAIASDAITAAKIADGAIDAATFAAGAITATVIATGAIDADALATDAVNEIVDQVWRETLADHSGTSGSTAEALNAAGGAGDPWITALPGAYSAGSAGYILGTNLNATVSSRASQTSVDTVDDFLDTEIAAIKAKTDNLPADPSDASDIAAAFSTVNSTLSTIAGYIDTEVAAILAAVDTEIATIVTATGASAIRAAVGLASANLDTQLDALPTNAELATAITTGLTTALTEGYRATNATGSVRDLLYEITAHLGEFSISSTTKQLKKIDGSTNAKSYTLNDATSPTAITETT